jgi:hypothetical protein
MKGDCYDVVDGITNFPKIEFAVFVYIVVSSRHTVTSL